MQITIFETLTHKIDEDLLYTKLVWCKWFDDGRVNISEKVYIWWLVLNVNIHRVHHILDKFLNFKRPDIELVFSSLDLRYIEEIWDKKVEHLGTLQSRINERLLNTPRYRVKRTAQVVRNTI